MDWKSTVFSDGTEYFVSNPLPRKGDTIEISLRIREWSPVKRIVLRTKCNGVETQLPMNWDYSRDGLAYFKTSVRVLEPQLHYHFYLMTEDRIYYYNQSGLSESMPAEACDFKILTDYSQPQWVKSAAFYQIFPERFCNGNPFNDVGDGEYFFDGHPSMRIRDWNQAPSRYDQSHCLDFYGGDLEGVLRKIPYLKQLGITAVYLNPIFYAATVHKYDCLDYFQVDPHFGGNQALERLSRGLHQNGMKLILDVSINHTGQAHRWFNKEAAFFPRSEGAFWNPAAPERDYYFFTDKHSYRAWNDVETLPTLNYTSEALRDKIYRGEDSVVLKWLKPPYEIDGWRFDVADTMARNDELQLHHEVWPEIRESIKKQNPDSYILAEDWCDCAEFLNGDEWDAPMNYFGCARPIREFAGERDLLLSREPFTYDYPHTQDAGVLAGRIKNWLSLLPTVIAQNMFNLLDSHDTPRLHNNPEVSWNAWRNATLLQFALPGCVSIYYGDEAGIDGRIDDMEGCRYPMPWDSEFRNGENYKLYERLLALRKESEAMTKGSFLILYAKDKQFVCARFTDTERILFLCSMEKHPVTIGFSVAALGDAVLHADQDLLGQPVNAQLSGDWLQVSFPAEGGFVLALEKKL